MYQYISVLVSPYISVWCLRTQVYGASVHKCMVSPYTSVWRKDHLTFMQMVLPNQIGASVQKVIHRIRCIVIHRFLWITFLVAFWYYFFCG